MDNAIYTLIKKYYAFFNAGDMVQFETLLNEDVIHDINQGGTEIGKKKFMAFMDHMNTCYKEHIDNLVIMTNENSQHASASFTVSGTYLKTDSGLPEAKGQHYQLPAGTFFEIRDGKLSRVTTYYNLKEWLQQFQDKYYFQILIWNYFNYKIYIDYINI